MQNRSASGLRAIRTAWRLEMQPEELSILARLLSGLPQAAGVQPALRLAAAGRELIYVRRFLGDVERLIREGELQAGSSRERELPERLSERTTALVLLIEEHLGPFPKADDEARHHGARETFLVETLPERQKEALWLIDLAHQASDAPTPPEPVVRMLLRAAGEDFLEISRYLGTLAESVEDAAFRDLALAIARACDELAASIARQLPAIPAGSEATR